MPTPFHLAWFLQGSSAQAWGEAWTGHIGTTWMVPELFIDLSRGLERACFDYVLIEDSRIKHTLSCLMTGTTMCGQTQIDAVVADQLLRPV
jgi:hypothetical protein